MRAILLEDPLNPLRFVATVERLATSDTRQFAAPFFIPGRRARSMICEFHLEKTLAFEAKAYPMSVELRYSGEHAWTPACEFELHLNNGKATTVNGGSLVPLDNE